MTFSFKEAFLMPFTSISRKILCEDLFPLFPLPPSPVSVMIPMSVSYYEVQFSASVVFYLSIGYYCGLRLILSSSNLLVPMFGKIIINFNFLLALIFTNNFFFIFFGKKKISIGCLSSCLLSADLSKKAYQLHIFPNTG